MTAGEGSSGRLGLLAVIFDMDGVLIDTEPQWREVETECLSAVGVSLTDDDCRSTMGMRIDEVVRLWFERRPWSGASPHEVCERIVDGMVLRVREAGAPMPGAVEALTMVRASGRRCAVASSSPIRLIEAVRERLGIAGLVEAFCSAEHEASGKPAPDVYLRTAAAVDVQPGACLAIEDSVQGLAAAQAAGMACVVVPDITTASDPGLETATMRLGSLEELSGEVLETLSAAYFA